MKTGLKRSYITDINYTDEQLKKWGIYLIRCIANNKVYVGQTKSVGGFNLRWLGHLSALRNQKCNSQHLQRTFNKYGEESFVFSIIEYIDIKDKKLLNEREIYWINYYNSSHRDYGLNITDGGDGGNGLVGEKSHCSLLKDYQVEDIKLRLLDGESPSKIAREYGVSKSVINSIKACRTYFNVLPEVSDKLANLIIKDRKGETVTHAKLTNELVREIKYRLVEGQLIDQIISEMKLVCDRHIITKIKNVTSWSSVASELNDKLYKLIDHRPNLTQEELTNIRVKYASGEYTQKEIGELYGISQACVGDIVNYKERYTLKEGEEYISPLPKRIEFSKKELNEIRTLFSKGNITKVEISKLYNCSDSTINKIIYYKEKYKLDSNEEYIKPFSPEITKLSYDDFYNIRILYQSNYDATISDIAKQFNITKATARAIVNYTGSYKLKDGEVQIINNRDIPKVELTQNDIDTIRYMKEKEGITYDELAKEYKVSRSTIKRIVLRYDNYADR